jgi:hypothetical protein
MEPNLECATEAQGLLLVRSFRSLSPENRQRVLQLVEELLRKQERPEEGTETSRP